VSVRGGAAVRHVGGGRGHRTRFRVRIERGPRTGLCICQRWGVWRRAAESVAPTAAPPGQVRGGCQATERVPAGAEWSASRGGDDGAAERFARGAAPPARGGAGGSVDAAAAQVERVLRRASGRPAHWSSCLQLPRRSVCGSVASEGGTARFHAVPCRASGRRRTGGCERGGSALAAGARPDLRAALKPSSGGARRARGPMVEAVRAGNAAS
jgi:hypothetical protein